MDIQKRPMSNSHSAGKTRRSPGACVILGRVLGMSGGGTTGWASWGAVAALEAVFAFPGAPESIAGLPSGAEASTEPLGAAVAASPDTGADLTTEATPAATAPAAATAAAAGPTATPTVAAATPTVVAAAAAAPPAATEVVTAAGAVGFASADLVKSGLPPTGLAGIRPSDGGDEVRVETPFTAGRTSSDAGSITLVTSGVETAGVVAATLVGVDWAAA